jgi:hypothetical protein
MDLKANTKEVLLILISALILGFSAAMFNLSFVFSFSIIFIIIITLNILVKKLVAYYHEADANLKFWNFHRFWFTERSHFPVPIPMFWLPIFLSYIARGSLQWLGILETNITPRIERAVRRHKIHEKGGVVRVSEITEKESATILGAGVILNILLALIALVIFTKLPSISSLVYFAKFNAYYSLWSLIPVSSLDGTKILMGRTKIWIALIVLSVIVSLICMAM